MSHRQGLPGGACDHYWKLEQSQSVYCRSGLICIDFSQKQIMLLVEKKRGGVRELVVASECLEGRSASDAGCGTCPGAGRETQGG